VTLSNALPYIRAGKLRAAGIEPAFRGPRQMAAMMQGEVESFRRLTAAAGITAE